MVYCAEIYFLINLVATYYLYYHHLSRFHEIGTALFGRMYGLPYNTNIHYSNATHLGALV